MSWRVPLHYREWTWFEFSYLIWMLLSSLSSFFPRWMSRTKPWFYHIQYCGRCIYLRHIQSARRYQCRSKLPQSSPTLAAGGSCHILNFLLIDVRCIKREEFVLTSGNSIVIQEYDGCGEETSGRCSRDHLEQLRHWHLLVSTIGNAVCLLCVFIGVILQELDNPGNYHITDAPTIKWQDIEVLIFSKSRCQKSTA